MTKIGIILAEIQVEKLSAVDIFIFRNNDFPLQFSLGSFSSWSFMLIVGRTSMHLHA